MTTEKLITSAQTDKVADLGREAVKTAVGKVNPTSTNVQTGIISNGREFKNRVEEAVKASRAFHPGARPANALRNGAQRAGR